METSYQDIAQLDAEATLRFYADMEQGNFAQMLKLLHDDILFYKRLETQYATAVSVITDPDATLVYQFYAQAQHQLTTAMLQLCRGHLVDSKVATRLAIENAAYAHIFNNATKEEQGRLLELWAHRDDNLDAFRVEFGERKLFPKNDSAMMRLKTLYDNCCVASHPNLVHQGMRTVISDDQVKNGYFDFPENDPTGWYTRAIHHIYRTHIEILNLFSVHFSSHFADAKTWKAATDQLSTELAQRVDHLRQTVWLKDKDK